MACEIRVGRGGVKAGLFRLSQPNGAVMTTSSNAWADSELVRSTILGFSMSVGGGWDSIEVTMLENWMSAWARAVAATRSRIALYVLATNRFSVNR